MVNFSEWEILIAPPNEQEEIFVNSLKSFFGMFPCSLSELTHENLISDGKRPTYKLVIIPQFADGLHGHLLGILLEKAYCINSRAIELTNCRFLFLSDDMYPESLSFHVLVKVLQDVGIGRVSKPFLLFPALKNLLFPDQEIGLISSKTLQKSIENYLPSGAEGLQELIFRNSHKMHEIFHEIESYPTQKPSILPAVRMLAGAYSAGAIDEQCLQENFELITARRRDKNKQDFIKSKGKLIEWIREIANERKKFNFPPENTTPFLEYLNGRKILIIEDMLVEEYWDIVLSSIMGLKEVIVEKKLGHPRVDQTIGEVEITHVNNVREALDYCKSDLHKFDFILLDLYSSRNNRSTSSHEINTVTIGDPIHQLFERINKLYNLQINSVTIVIPRIVCFSFDRSGITTRTLLKDLGAAEYFFKDSQSEPHKGGYYSSFRSAVVSALKETVCHVTGLTSPEGRQGFDDWLNQFCPDDRPFILKMMKEFRYYSAMSIVTLFDNFLRKYYKPCEYNGSGCIQNTLSDTRLSPNSHWFSFLGRPNKSGPATLPLISKTSWLVKLDSYKELNKHYEESKQRKPVFISYETLRKNLIKEMIGNGNSPIQISILLTDDFIGSGGQLLSYFEKFFRKIYLDLEGDSDRDSMQLYNSLLSACNNEGRGETDCFVELHVAFAIGLQNDRIKKELQSNGKLLINEDGHSTWEMYGKACLQPEEHTEIEDCGCKPTIRYYLHILDYVCNATDYVDVNNLKTILKKYHYITRTRLNEYPCDFEPIGWKETGGLTATYANVQGNTLPIIWGDNIGIRKNHENKWTPLFPRFFNPWNEGESWREAEAELPCKSGKCCLTNEKVDYQKLPCK